VAFANDRLACGAWLAAQAEGVVVPVQAALMGFGDFPLARQLGSGITSMAPPRYGIGEHTPRVGFCRACSTRPQGQNGTHPLGLRRCRVR
jgi:LacI family transcriptional regulator, gluconate utilization system Gnt-I transcriptional repressor